MKSTVRWKYLLRVFLAVQVAGSTTPSIMGCARRSGVEGSVTTPSAATDGNASASSHITATGSEVIEHPQEAATAGEWRITTVLDSPVGIAWCPAESDSCAQIHSVGTGAELREVARSSNRQSVAFFRLEDGSCELHVCFDRSCGSPVDSVCNPNNGSLRWLPSGYLLYRGSGGGGISVASLFGRDGKSLWSSVHVVDEISPSMGYLLVGASSTNEVFAEVDSIEIVELDGPRSVEIVAVPPGADVHANWADDRVKLTWPGGARDVPLRNAGTAARRQH